MRTVRSISRQRARARACVRACVHVRAPRGKEGRTVKVKALGLACKPLFALASASPSSSLASFLRAGAGASRVDPGRIHGRQLHIFEHHFCRCQHQHCSHVCFPYVILLNPATVKMGAGFSSPECPRTPGCPRTPIRNHDQGPHPRSERCAARGCGPPHTVRRVLSWTAARLYRSVPSNIPARRLQGRPSYTRHHVCHIIHFVRLACGR